MEWDQVDWQALARLRTSFLEGTAGAQDYWQSDRDLDSYDQTYGQRIRWKWDYVLNELRRRGWSPPPGELINWGCGSGIEARAFLETFGAEPVSTLVLWDRSPLAMHFAAGKVRKTFPQINVWLDMPPQRPFATLLISHVLTELTAAQIDELIGLAVQATSVVWVEPGTHEASRGLVAIRERLRDQFQVVAPCTHQAACGMLATCNERHWCHHFAPSPPEVFMDGNWARFAKIAGIDLRSLPLSFLVLDRRPVPELPAGATRVIGRPRIYKPHALLLGCDATGVHERRLTKRTLPEDFRQLKKDRVDALQVWRSTSDEVIETRPLCDDEHK